MRTIAFTPPAIALLPRAPRNASPVPGLTSLHAKSYRGPYGDARYPGNCGGELIKDLLRYFRPAIVFDPMTGSGTCRDVCDELGIDCASKDIRFGFDACDPQNFRDLPQFDFVWLHPPYWRQKIYTGTQGDLSSCSSLDAFLDRYERLIRNCANVLKPGGRMAILMGDYSDREAGFVPLIYHTKRLCFEAGLRQACTDIVRFSHNASSSRKVYASSFIPGLHDICAVFEK
jgi:DNA modification methylase